MQVNAVLVDEVALEGSPVAPVAKAVLCTFESPTFVSARRVDTTERLGPIGVLEDEQAAAVREFPPRALLWEGRAGEAFSYKEPWTAPPWTLYVLVPPPEFFGSSLTLLSQEFAAAALDVASFEDRVFYFSLLGSAAEQHAFTLEARFVHDPSAVARKVRAVETVAGRRKWRALRDSVAGPLGSTAAVVRFAAVVRALLGL